MKEVIACVVLASLVVTALTAECHSHPGPVHENPSPILNANPKLLRTSTNGRLYKIGDQQHDAVVHLLHVSGTMYQMGYAQGQLLKNELNEFMSTLWSYIEEEFESALPKWVPKRFQKLVAGKGIAAALDLTYYITKRYTNPMYYQEMKGIADAANASFLLLRRVHMIGQLTKGTCSMFGAWGNATQLGKTIQLRSLDWDFDGPYWKYPLLTVYHPNSKKLGSKWMNIGFMGWVGVISGINQHRLAVSEIGVYFSDESWGKESRFGDPFTFVLRDILQFESTLNGSIARLQKTKRTCNLLLGVGDGKLQTDSFRGFQYSHSVCNVFSDKNLEPANDTWHPKISNVVYWGMDWLCPPFNQRFAEQLNTYYGNLSAENTIRNILPSIDSGNLQAVVYDLTDNFVYIAYGFIGSDGKKRNAFDRAFIKLNMTEVFSD